MQHSRTNLKHGPKNTRTSTTADLAAISGPCVPLNSLRVPIVTLRWTLPFPPLRTCSGITISIQTLGNRYLTTRCSLDFLWAKFSSGISQIDSEDLSSTDTVSLSLFFGTIYLTQSSTGVNGSLSIMPLLGSWRFVTGFGTGGNFVLNPIIAAEYGIYYCLVESL